MFKRLILVLATFIFITSIKEKTLEKISYIYYSIFVYKTAIILRF